MDAAMNDPLTCTAFEKTAAMVTFQPRSTYRAHFSPLGLLGRGRRLHR